MPAVRVLIADDHPQMLGAMVHVVESDDRFTVVGTATTGDDAVRLAGELEVDVALVDVRMPGGGPAAVRAFQALPSAPVIVAVSAETTAGVVAAMVRAGVVGYLAKGRIGESLPEVLARCAAGEVVLATGSAAGALRLLLDR
ncbi:hypothetical protein GCM10025782_15130 [Pedococcus ginsenosidimutans]|uniref:Response regulatory domain-containing protein n=1 Tax=Pedococcus ginsenosidimutans TaxID=490570 RepID=A0ABP8Y2L8_9MICO